LLSADIADKIDALRREVNYLISKAKYFKPKPKPTPKPTTTKTEETKEDAGKEEKAEKEPEEEKAQDQESEQKQDEKQQYTEQEPEINIEDIFKDESVPKRKPKPIREAETPNADEKLELGEDTSKIL
jgi:hypothetical protein